MNSKSLLIPLLMILGLHIASTAVIAGDTVSTVSPKVAPAYKILFFMNPNGRPCQIQDAIIKEMGESFSTKAQVTYYKTTERTDYKAFGTYGIRGLPSLIILDAKGKEVKRFTPGIQSAETILGALSR